MSVGLLFDFRVNKWEYDCAVEAIILTWPYLGVTTLSSPRKQDTCAKTVL